MKAFAAFTKKEVIQLIRTGKFTILVPVFILFGIMNPAMAKLTPWMMELMSGSLADAGFAITGMEVNALTAWGQFYKNIPMALIVFLLMFSGTLTAEYQKGTLINILTKGLSRWKVIAAKALITTLLWSACYWLCFGISYGYTAYYWNNSIASYLFFSAFCFYFAGVWLISLLFLMSTFFHTNSAVLLGTGGAFGVVYLASLVPSLQEYLPARLFAASNLLTGAAPADSFYFAILITLALIILNVGASILLFNKKAF